MKYNQKVDLTIKDRFFNYENADLIDRWADTNTKQFVSEKMSGSKCAKHIIQDFIYCLYAWCLEKPFAWSPQAINTLCTRMIPESWNGEESEVKQLPRIFSEFLDWLQKTSNIENVDALKSELKKHEGTIMFKHSPINKLRRLMGFHLEVGYVRRERERFIQSNEEEISPLNNEEKNAKLSDNLKDPGLDKGLDQPLSEESRKIYPSPESVIQAIKKSDFTHADSLIECSNHYQEELTPNLIKILEEAIVNKNTLLKSDSSYLIAMFWLSKHRKTQAFGQVIDLLTLPKKQADHFMDTVFRSGTIESLIISTFNGQTDLIDRLILDEGVAEYIRCASIQSYTALYQTKQIPYESLVSNFRKLLKKISDQIKTKDNYEQSSITLGFLANEVLDNYAEELFDELVELFVQGLIPREFVGLNSLTEVINNKEETIACNANKYQFIDNLQEEFSFLPYIENDDQFEPANNKGYSLNEKSRQPEPMVSSRSKIGRNDKCPCGSGKKYKKCCL